MKTFSFNCKAIRGSERVVGFFCVCCRMAAEGFSSIQKAWNKVDGNNDGSVDYQEFVKFMNSDTVAEKMGGECIDMPT